MSTVLGKLIYERRLAQGLTQDQFGSRYGVSGPAIFKFEKGYVNPSFKLWMNMAADFDLGEGVAVLLWAKAKLPPEYQELLELKGGKVKDTDVLYKAGAKRVDYSRLMNRDKLREAVLDDPGLPTGLKSLVKDEEIWQIYKPTGREVGLLRDFYGRFGDGTKGRYREGLRLLRDFTGREG
jgi:transcriptional regulator with XRE-family HTH domain